MNALFTRLAGTALLLISLPLQAITISLDPLTQSVSDGSIVNVALDISGLGSGMAPSISTFDLDINFNAAILGYTGAVFGDPVKGDQLDLFGLGSLITATPGAGTLNLFELSFDAAADLNFLQADSFTLATLSFNTLSAGMSPLGISLNALGDANGDPLTADLIGASVIVNANINPGSAPEPATWLLLAVGALAMNRFTHQSLSGTEFVLRLGRFEQLSN